VKVAFAGTFAVRLADRVRAHLKVPCDVVVADEVEIVPRLSDVDVLVTLAFTPEMGAAAHRHALARKTIAGAALDVWYRYPSGPGPMPPSRHPFHELPNVLMTPHVAGWTEATLDARAQLIAENIGRVARDEAPLNLISSPVGS
jgi:hypothetical protein